MQMQLTRFRICMQVVTMGRSDLVMVPMMLNVPMSLVNLMSMLAVLHNVLRSVEVGVGKEFSLSICEQEMVGVVMVNRNRCLRFARRSGLSMLTCYNLGRRSSSWSSSGSKRNGSCRSHQIRVGSEAINTK